MQLALAPMPATHHIRVEPVSEVTAHSLLRHSAAHPPALEPDSAGQLVPARFDDEADRANRRVTVRSNLPGLAPDWDPVAAFRLSTRARSVEQANDAPVGAPEESIGQPLTPRFQRYLPEGREYYFWIDRSLPDIEHRGGHYHIRRQEIVVRVQWRRDTENDELPRVLPAPGPTEPRPDDLVTPDFEQTGRRGWADQEGYPPDGGGTVRIRSQRRCRHRPP